MIIGQSAGTIASMVIEKGINIHDVKFDELEEILSKDGLVLSMN